MYGIDGFDVVALYPNGNLKWKAQAPGADYFVPVSVVGGDGTVFVGTYNGSVCALNPQNGAVMWEISEENNTPTALALGSDGTLFVSTAYDDGASVVYAISSVNAGADSVASISLPAMNAGTSELGTVNLTKPAPAGGWTVYLQNTSSEVSLPQGSINIPAGQQSATFLVSASPSTSSYASTITASDMASKQSTNLTVNGDSVKSVAASPNPFGWGRSSCYCTVTLNAPAPSGGWVVNLVSQNPMLKLPGTVTVPAGSTSTTFQIFPASPGGFGKSYTTQIQASDAASSASTVLTVNYL